MSRKQQDKRKIPDEALDIHLKIKIIITDDSTFALGVRL
jgi:hypothetical protein